MKLLSKKTLFYSFFLVVFTTQGLFGQEETATSSDTSRVRETTQRSDLEGPIKYEAQVIDNLMNDRKTILTGRAQVSYLNMTLAAEKITVDWENDLMRAEGIWDTIWVKEGGLEDSVQVMKLMGAPEFSEAGDVMRGEVMVYNFQTRKGRVLRGRTAYEDGFYSGSALKIVKPKSINVSNAAFTTCDKEKDPHFHFSFQKMKIDVNSKVIAKPVVLYIGHIPILALPFVYFPIRRGRHSGILVPRYGESQLEGRFLRGLGYYWAASDYWDVKGTVDYFEKSGFLFRGDLNYAVKYKFSGTLSGSLTRKNFEVLGNKERRWDLAVRHSQTISPTMQFSVSGQFVSSGSFYRELSANREHRLRQEIRSNATLSKRLGGSRSVTINLNQTRILKTDEITETLPRISFRGGQSTIFPKPKGEKGEITEGRWYHSIYVSYNSQLLAQRSKKREGYGEDAPLVGKSSMGWDHTLRLSSPQKFFGWLTLNPSLNYQETWLDRRQHYSLIPETNTIQSEEEKGFFTRRTFNTSTSFGTKIYGIIRPRFIKNVMLRHVATPSLSFVYQPDFSHERFGYYQAVEDTQGVVKQYDQFSGSLFGSTRRGAQKALSFSLQNLFQMKIGDGENEKKFDLFTWILSSSYNWESEQYRLGDLSSSVRANPSRDISFNLRTAYSFYQFDENGNKVNRLFIDEIDWKDWRSIFQNRWARLTNLSANITLRFKGSIRTGGGGGEGEGIQAGAAGETADLGDLRNVPGDRFNMEEGGTGFDAPWNLNATLSYTDNRYNPLRPSKRFWARTSLDFNLTKNWKISYRAQFDLSEMVKNRIWKWNLNDIDIVSQDFVFKRDLHCWEAYITWTPTGYNKRFYFRISVKSPMLRDLKIEKGTGRRGFMGTSIQDYLY